MKATYPLVIIVANMKLATPLFEISIQNRRGRLSNFISQIQPKDYILRDHEIKKLCINIIETVSKKLIGEDRKL